MHSAKISDQKITKISKHQTGCTRGYGQERAHGLGPGKPGLLRDPFHLPPLPQGRFAETPDNLGSSFPRDTPAPPHSPRTLRLQVVAPH